MKKVIGIFFAMVLGFLISMSNVYATEIADIYPSKGYDLVLEWAESNGWTNWYNKVGEGEVAYGCGSLSIAEFENDTGLDWSMEDYKKESIERWDLCECEIKKVGEIEGYDIYLVEARSETTVVGTVWNPETESYEDYYCGSVLFMICK